MSIEVNNFCFFEKMGKSEFHVVNKHLYLKSLTSKEAVHGESAPVFATLYGRTSTKGEHRSRCLVEVSTPKMINRIHNTVLSD